MANVIQSNFRIRKHLGRVRKVIEIPNLIDIQKTSYDKFLQIERAAERAGGGRPPGRLPERLPDQGFQRDERARLRQLQPREAQVRRRRVPPARHDVRGADQGDDPAHDLRHPRGWRAHRARHQGAGGLLRRDPADDGDRDVHHQRHRARRRQPAAPQPGRLLRPRQGQDALERQAALQRPHHPVPRLVARLRVRPEGHHVRPHRPPPEDARDRAPPRARLLDAGPPQLLLQHRRRSTSRRAASTRRASSSTCSPASARPATSRSAARPSSRRTPSSPRRRSRSSATRRSTACRSTSRSSWARSPRTTSSTRRPARSSSRCNEEVTEAKLEKLREASIEEFKILFIDGLNVGSYLRDTLLAEKVKTTEDAIMEIYRRLRPGRSADARDGEDAVPQPVLQPRALRPVEGRPPQAELQVLPRSARGSAARARHRGPHPAGHPRDRSSPHRAEERPRLGRRHRPPRQPPRARGRRADGEPVPHRSRSHGARHQGAHEHVAGDRHADAARPHQRQARERGGQGVLRQLAALAVHGPDEPAQRGDAQAPPVARSGPAVSRASAPASRSATFTRRTTAASARSRRRKVRTSASSRRSRPSPASTSTASSRRRTAARPRAASPTRSSWFSALEEEGKYIAQASAVDGREGQVPRVARQRAPQRRLPHGHAGHDPAHGRGAEPDGVGRRGARARSSSTTTRTARSWARTCSARPCRSSAATRRSSARAWKASSRATRRLHPGARATASSRASTRRASSSAPTARRPEIPDIYPLMKFQRSNQIDLLQPDADRPRGRAGEGRRRPRRRSELRHGRARARPERARRVHAVAGLQLRGLDPRLRAHRQGRRLHLDSHRGVRVRRPRHEARQGRGHARHPERRRRGPEGPRRVAASSASAPR